MLKCRFSYFTEFSTQYVKIYKQGDISMSDFFALMTWISLLVFSVYIVTSLIKAVTGKETKKTLKQSGITLVITIIFSALSSAF